MGTAFGKSDNNATNDLNAAGDVVATGTGVKAVRDPNRGLDNSQVRNRKLLGVGGKALGGFSNPDAGSYGGGNGMGTSFNFADNQPQFQPPQPPQQQDFYTPLGKQLRNPFYG